MADLVRGLGGSAGFGENFLAPNDDLSTSEIDLSSVFSGPLDFFGTTFDSVFVNNNGNITIGTPLSTYTPFSLVGDTGLPIIAAYFADVDTRADESGLSPTPGGTSQGTDLVWYDLDTVQGIFTVTWDDVGVFDQDLSERNAFQLRLIDRADRGTGDFDIEFIYEQIEWHTGTASGTTPARAGFNSGNGTDFYEIAASGNIPALQALPATAGVGTGDAGRFLFEVVNGSITVVEAADDLFSVLHNTVETGNLFDDNGGGADASSDGTTLVSSFAGGAAPGSTVTLSSGAELTVEADGSFTYDGTGVPDWVDEDSFSYEISNGAGSVFDDAEVSIEFDDSVDGKIEVGEAEINTGGVTIDLINDYDDPVVVAYVATTRGPDSVAVRVDSISSDSMTLRLQEPSYDNGIHNFETVRYIVAERGAWVMEDGTRFQAGVLETDKLTSEAFEVVTFKEDFFDDRPAVFSHVQTVNDSDYVNARHTGADADGFGIAMQETEADNGGSHGSETLGWIAIETGVFTIDGQTVEVGAAVTVSGGSGTRVPLSTTFAGGANVVAQLDSMNGTDPAIGRGTGSNATGFTVAIYEDQSADEEMGHINETVSYLAFGEARASFAAEVDAPSSADQTTSATGTLPVTGQDVSVSITLPDASGRDSETVHGLISAGAVTVSGGANVALIVDVSGSVGSIFSGGVSVADLNNDGLANTILDAEIAGVEALVQSLVSNGLGSTVVDLIPFANSASSIFRGRADTDADSNGVYDVFEAAYTMSYYGGTYYDQGLQAAIDFLNSGSAAADASNYVFFMSDGIPSSTTNFAD